MRTNGNWVAARLGECGELRNGVNFNQTQEGVGLPVLKVKDFGDLVLMPVDGLDELNPRAIAIPRDQYLSEGDVVIIRSNGNGELVGRSLLVRGLLRPTTFSGFCIRFRPNVQRIDPRYAAYFIRSPICRQRFTAFGSGTGIQNLNQATISDVEIDLPSLEEQKAIARVLGVLDDKIELNRRMNQTLEGLARAMFKSWFVNFDPVVAKAAGKKPVGMSAQTAALFPDRFQDSALGPIPEGWKVATIGELVDVVGGSTPSTTNAAYWEDGTIAWATPKDLSNIADPVLIETERKITSEGLDQISSGLLPKGTVLLSSRAPVGYLAVAEIPVAVNQGFIAIKCGSATPNLFVLFWVQANMDEIESRANGTTFMEISKANFRPIPAVVPSSDVVQCFQASADRFLKRIVANIRQSRSLATFRDALLPHLMSGQLRVGDTEGLAEEALA